MEWQILVGPIVGAAIGYVTNKIAVEMLFKPLNPIYIGKFHVPFTPGIIPKGKERLGKAIGDVVGNSLLTTTILKETLLSEKMKTDLEHHLDTIFTSLSHDNSNLELKLQQILGENTLTRVEEDLLDVLTTKISQGLINMNLGEIVADEVMIAVQTKVKGTMLAMMFNASTLAPIVEEIKIRVNEYIENHGEEKVSDFIQEEYMNIKDQPISNLFLHINLDELKQIVLNMYELLINNYAETFLSTLNLSNIVEEKVCAMDIRELEDLLLLIMKKELGAVVNLGALIGFILGLVNILF